MSTSPFTGSAPEGSAPLLEARRRLLAQKLLDKHLAAFADDTPGLADPEPARVRLSSAQEALWVLRQFDGGESLYNVGAVTRLLGPLDVERLERSFRALISRHAALRTCIEPAATGPMQRVMPAPSVVPLFQLQRGVVSPEDAKGTALDQRVDELLAQPFDLAHAPLLRAALLRISPDHHLLVLSIHHIVSDGWSMSIINRELGALYSQDGEPAALPDLPLSFAAYAAHQRQRYEGATRHPDADYWQLQLRDLPSLDLPADKPRRPQTGFAGRTLAFHIDGPIRAGMGALAQQHGTTMFTALLAAFQVLLMRYSGQSDIPVGIPVAGRDDNRLANVIGYFVNTVVIRGRLDGSPDFIELLQRTRTTVIDALAHADLPFDRLVADLHPQREGSRNPLYQISFALERFSDHALELAGVKTERLALHPKTAKFDLSLGLTDEGDGLDARFEFRTDLFEWATVDRMARHFRHLLSAILADPHAPVDRLPLLDHAEREQLLTQWGAGVPAAHGAQLVHTLFRAQARSTPHAVALRLAQEQMSYGQLDALSDYWAHQLAMRGVGPEIIVGLFMHRSFALAVAMLAILKAGGAFMPLDPEYPPGRVKVMVRDAKPRVILTQPHLVATLGAIASDVDLVAMPDDGGRVPSSFGLAVETDIRPEHLAYVIYTSGSTGKPKGAQVLHGGLANHLLWLNGALGLTAADRILQKTTISFDASIWEFLSPLICGAQVVFAEPGAQRDVSRLLRIVQEQNISIMQFVPSALRTMLAEPHARQCNSLRYVLSGGEALDCALAQQFLEVLPGVRFGNFYGPSEATDISAWLEIRAPLPDRLSVPIGRPAANVALFVLDAYQELQPIGVVGELYIGGDGVGRGYLNHPDLTAERFLPNPFRSGERMYRTGDFVRWLGDGLMEFIGRADHQVKLRGFRIELGEIEAVLNTCPGVRMSAVSLQGGDTASKKLTAYIAADQPDLQALRKALKEQLPEHMLPQVYVMLEALPVLPNGKIDRNNLPAAHDAFTGDFVAPRSGLESGLLEIWQAALLRQRIGVRDNFFELGGDSLSATRVMSQIRAIFGVDMPLRVLFDRPTVAELAQTLQSMLNRGEDVSPIDPIIPVPRAGPLQVSFSQRRMWTLHQMDPKGAAYNMRVALRLRGNLDRSALQAALNALAARHEAFRTGFVFGETEPVALVNPSAAVQLHELDMQTIATQGRDAMFEDAVVQLAAAPFDLRRGTLCRFILARLEPQHHALIMVMHHIIGDDWSWGIVLDELSALYRAHHRGLTPALRPKPIDFYDYAAWQRQRIDHARLARHADYWMQQLDGMSPLNLPTDTSVVQRQSSRGARLRRPFDDHWLRSLQQFSAAQGVTPFMTLLAAFQCLLSRWCAQSDITVGAPVANRTEVDAETVVGSLVNTLAMRSEVRPDMSFRELLQQVRGMTFGAFTNQDLPFDYLVERLRKDGAGASAADLRVLFNVLNTPRKTVQLEGLQVDYLPLSLGAAQFDLSLHVDIAGEHALILSYSTELFVEKTMEGLLESFLLLVDDAMHDPDRALKDLRLTTLVDRASLDTWNRTARPYRSDLTVTSLLAAQRKRATPAIQVSDGAGLSHAELWLAVDRLTEVLRQRGVHRGDLVGLSVDRGASMVVAQLAALQAGAAYVPLDPTYPSQRLHEMAEDARLCLLITEQSRLAIWEGLGVPCLFLDAEHGAIAQPAAMPAPPDPERDARAEDPAYVIYTSGSTGKPKGVVVPHRAVVNFLSSMQREPGLSANDRLVAVTTISFDIAVLELLLPLAVGGTIILATREQATDGKALRALLEGSGGTVMQATPSTWNLLIEAGWEGRPDFKALVGGETLSADLAQALLARTGELWNMYGPTETTVWSTCYKVQPKPSAISIGGPIANTQIHVLDSQGQPCPIGFGGEIHIGGDGVAIGYLNQPELTADRFIPDPFCTAIGARLYKTGDRGRWRHDGVLEHQGRLDFQVKVRGYRIELGEIESRLQAHPDVKQAVVLVREDAPGDRRLVAYAVPNGITLDLHALREHLRAALPTYLLPQHFVVLEHLPLLPNGKINRHALPMPRQQEAVLARDDRAGMTPAEQALAHIWRELIGCEMVGRSDNFFDLGGHSLLANRAAIAFEKISGHRLELRRMVLETLGQLVRGVDLPETPHDRVAPQAASGPIRRWIADLSARIRHAR